MNIPIVVSVAPNGSSKTKIDHQRLPMLPEELARDAKECKDAGATLIHVHVRNNEGKHTLDIAPYKEAIAAIKETVGDQMIIQVTSEAVGIYSAEEQMAMIEKLKPEAVSIALKELIPEDSDENKAQDFLRWVLSEKISPQYVLYSAQELQRFYTLKARGVIPGDKQFLLFVLGRYSANKESHPEDLLPFINIHNLNKTDNSVKWAVCAFGKAEIECVLKAASLGGHIRIGFENNLYLQDGSLAKNNAELISQFRSLYPAENRCISTIEEAKELVLC